MRPRPVDHKNKGHVQGQICVKGIAGASPRDRFGVREAALGLTDAA